MELKSIISTLQDLESDMCVPTEEHLQAIKAVRQLAERVDEGKIKEIVGSRLDCPNCDNTGSYADHSPYCGGDCDKAGCPEQVQCEFCYTQENSKFNVAKAIIEYLEGEKS